MATDFLSVSLPVDIPLPPHPESPQTHSYQMIFSKYLHCPPPVHTTKSKLLSKCIQVLCDKGSDFLFQTQCPASLSPTVVHGLFFTSETLPSLVPPPFTWLPPSSIRSQRHHHHPRQTPRLAGPSSSVLMQVIAPAQHILLWLSQDRKHHEGRHHDRPLTASTECHYTWSSSP